MASSQRRWRSLIAGFAGGLALLYGSTAFAVSDPTTSTGAAGQNAPAEQSPASSQVSTSLSAVKAGSKKAAIIEGLVAADGYSSVVEGNGPVHLTVFIDPNCIYCHLFWKDLTKTKGWTEKYTIRWVPLAFLKPSSRGKAGEILKKGAAGMADDEANFDVQDEEGAISQTADPGLLKKVKANTMRWARDMKALGLEAGTPTIVTGNGHVFAGLVSLHRLDRADASQSKAD